MTDRKITVIIAITLALAYLATLTADYYWDGITFALQIEKVARMERGSSLLFHQNHLLYNALGYIAYAFVRASSIPTRALYVLQITNTIAAAAAAGVFFRLAERLTHSRYVAVISTAALAFAAVWWKIATDANAYVISILLMLICASTLLSARPRWIIAGLALGGAMLVHQLASLFYPAALVAVFTHPGVEKKWKFATSFSLLAWGMTIVAYYLCAFLLNDLKDPLAVMKWATSNPSGVSPSANPLHGLASLVRGSPDMFLGHSLALFRSQGNWTEQLFALVALLSAILFLIIVARRGRLKRSLRGFTATEERASWKRYAPMLITWIGAYVLFLLFWEPWQVLYRAFYLPPAALALGLLLKSYHHATRTRPSGAAAIAVSTMLFFNLAFYIAPHMRATANPLIAAARDADLVWNDKTVIYFADHNEADTTFEYFNNKTEWRKLSAAGARAGIDDEIQRVVSQGGQVWLNKGACDLVGGGWLATRSGGRQIVVESPGASARYVELTGTR